MNRQRQKVGRVEWSKRRRDEAKVRERKWLRSDRVQMMSLPFFHCRWGEV